MVYDSLLLFGTADSVNETYSASYADSPEDYVDSAISLNVAEEVEDPAIVDETFSYSFAGDPPALERQGGFFFMLH